MSSPPKMVDLDHSRTIDLESLRLQYADKFQTYIPKARSPLHNSSSPGSHNHSNPFPSSPDHDADGHAPRRKYKLEINPPLLNSSSPWATDLEQLQALYDSPYTGAVTTRTSLLEGFTHDDTVHQHTFFAVGQAATLATLVDPSSAETKADTTSGVAHTLPQSDGKTTEDHPTFKGTPTPALASTSLNTYGYSPMTLSEYLGLIQEVVGQRHLGTSTLGKKPFIISVAGSPQEIEMSYALLANAAEMDEDLRLAMEVNLSCPNIWEGDDGKAREGPPPGYDPAKFKEYLEAIGDSKATYRGRMAQDSVPRVGIKLPPYVYAEAIHAAVAALRDAKSSEPGEGSVIDFITCTNTLGTSLMVDSLTGKPILNNEAGTGLGGMAGAALHPLALGNVSTFRRALDQYDETRDIMIIGVGGVEDRDGFERMRKVGAEAVGLATALGRFGVGVFDKITNEKIVKGAD